MVNYGDGILKKIAPIIFMLDTSGSMCGESITALNGAMHELCSALPEIQNETPDFELRVGVMTYASDVKWITSELIAANDIVWNDITAGGITNFGEAIKEIDRRFTRKDLFSSEIGYALPTIICVSDGAPSDNWEKAFNEAKRKNAWFRSARKIAFSFGDDADKNVLAEFCGTDEMVIEINDFNEMGDKILRLIRIISATGIEGLNGIRKSEYSLQLYDSFEIPLYEYEEKVIKYCQLHPCAPEEANLDLFSLYATSSTLFDGYKGVVMKYLDGRLPEIAASHEHPYSVSELSDIVISREISENEEFAFSPADYGSFYLVGPYGGWGNLQEMELKMSGDKLVVTPIKNRVLLQRIPVFGKEYFLQVGDSLVSKKYGRLFTVVYNPNHSVEEDDEFDYVGEDPYWGAGDFEFSDDGWD